MPFTAKVFATLMQIFDPCMVQQMYTVIMAAALSVVAGELTKLTFAQIPGSENSVTG